MIRKACLILAVVGLSNILCADVQITDVKATPISPWAVKIDYNVSGELPENNESSYVAFGLIVSNVVTHQSYYAKKGTVTGDIPLYLGKHCIQWNFPNDNVYMSLADVRFVIQYDVLFPYCVIDLSDGSSASSYPVSYLKSKPSGGWTDEYKMNKLVLRLIKPGTFMMGHDNSLGNRPHQVTLTKPYYIGIFEVTQKQYDLVKGVGYLTIQGDMKPMYGLSWNTIRGNYNWPSVRTISSSSFVGRLYKRTGMEFDLPTEAQWEYACQAGSTTEYYYGNTALGSYMWYNKNYDSSEIIHIVGLKRPNSWGLYDMLGNVSEPCLDWAGEALSGIDPEGPSTGSFRTWRGGSYYSVNWMCTSSYKAQLEQSSCGDIPSSYGFRVVANIPQGDMVVTEIDMLKKDE